MGFFVLDATKDAAKWANLVDMLPANLRDVHFSPEFMAAQAMLGHAPRMAVYTYQDYVVVQPFILRDVEISGIWTGYRDIANAVGGFGGPASNHNCTLYAWFAESFTAWCRDNRIVTEFCALHPMMHPHQKMLLSRGPELRQRKEVVVIDLSGSHAVADGYHKRRVQGIAAARKAGVRVFNHPFPRHVDASVAGPTAGQFISLYRETMLRQGAAQRWYLPDEHLLALCGFGIVFAAYKDGEDEPESAALLIGRKSGDRSTAYYHLAGNALRNIHVGANDLLIHDMVMWAKAAGFRWLHLGGGASSSPDDSVLFYKAGFSDLRRPAMSYFRVFDPSAYKMLCAAKAEEEIDATGAEFTTSFEPMYRREAV